MTLKVCNMCRRVCDTSKSGQRWVTKKEYIERRGHQLLLGVVWSHDYCPKCVTYFSSYRQAA